MKAKSLVIIFALFAAIIILPSCFKSAETNDNKTTKTPDKSSPMADKSTSPVTQAKGDFNQAKSDYDAKNYEKAVAGFQEIVDSDLNNLNARYFLGKSQQALKKDDEAIKSFKEAIKIKPDHADSNFELGNIYYGRKEYETALPFYQQAVKTNFKDPKMLMALGDNYSAMLNLQLKVLTNSYYYSESI